jgi:trans-aconitate 2-methyltransferase
MARIPEVDPASIVDPGCGTGNLTAPLAERWPDARVRGIDSSLEMVNRARADHPTLAWQVGDVSTWKPTEAVDVIHSNAILHWLDDHD